MKPRKVCTIEGCDKPGMQRGWCSMHYSRWLRNGVHHLATPVEKFWAQIQRTSDGCWEWAGNVSEHGYGRFGRTWAHRYSYELLVEPIPEGLTIDHLCVNPPCVNPAHMETITQGENASRAWDRHRKPHCPKGHLFDEANTYISPTRGVRVCRSCTSERSRQHYLRTRTPGPGKVRGERHPLSKLTEEDVRQIVAERAAGASGPALARRFGVGHNLIYRIVAGTAWSHVDRTQPQFSDGSGPEPDDSDRDLLPGDHDTPSATDPAGAAVSAAIRIPYERGAP